MKRVVVIGCAGSGKSTLARSLGATLGAPVAERDALGAEGTPAARSAIVEAVSGDRWIFDGYPYFADDDVFPLADSVIAFDFPFRVVLWRVLRRTLRIELMRRAEGAHSPQGLKAFRDPQHPLRWAVISHRARHREVLELCERLGQSHNVVRLRSPGEAFRWLESVKEKQ